MASPIPHLQGMVWRVVLILADNSTSRILEVEIAMPNLLTILATQNGTAKTKNQTTWSTYVNMVYTVNFELLRVFASGFYKLKTDFSTVRSPAPPSVRGFVSDVTR